MMMKKLLIFMLVLGMASAANAGLVISIHEVGGAEYDGHLLDISDELWLDVEAVDGDTGIGEGETFYFALVADMSLGVVNGDSGVTNIPPAPDASSLLGWAVADMGMGGIPAGYDGPAGAVDYLSVPGPPPFPDGVYFDEILFHCEGLGDVEILLMEVDMGTWAATGVVYDSVVIHQIPEPMTVLLLGLGGLFLRRRK